MTFGCYTVVNPLPSYPALLRIVSLFVCLLKEFSKSTLSDADMFSFSWPEAQDGDNIKLLWIQGSRLRHCGMKI